MHLNLKSRQAILLVALAVAGVSAWLTINGMTALFKGAFNTMIAVTVVLEVGKLSIAGWLVVGHHTRLKIPLAIIMTALMMLALAGHFGFLSEAYTKETAIQTVTQSKATRLEGSISRYEEELVNMRTIIDKMPDNFVTRRNELYRDMEPRREELNRLIDSLHIERNLLTEEEYRVDLQIGPFKHLAKLFGLSQDAVARLISFWISLLIDPLALLLIMVGAQTVAASGSPKEYNGGGGDGGHRKKGEKKRGEKDEGLVTSSGPSPSSTASSSLGRPPASPPTPGPVIIDPIAQPTKVEGSVVRIGGKHRDAIFKLAPVLGLTGPVGIDLANSTQSIEDLCSLLPNVVSVTIDSPEKKYSFDLSDNPIHGGWLVDYYTHRLGTKPFTVEEWFGCLSGLLPLAPVSSLRAGSVYINLEDPSFEQRLKNEVPSLRPDLTFYFESLTSRKNGNTLDIVRRATTYPLRIVSLGHLSSALEMFGLSHLAYQNGIDDKVASAYKMPGSKTIPPHESELIKAIREI